ncbi:MAG: hypothetical protein K2K97_02755 [Muribaculaceae bacterium]|nr:hypothetical protein [Muribaculaceae bacterium]
MKKQLLFSFASGAMLLGATLALLPTNASISGSPSPKAIEDRGVEIVLTPDPGSTISKAEWTIAFPNATAVEFVDDEITLRTTDFSTDLFVTKFSVTEVQGAACPTYTLVPELDGYVLSDGEKMTLEIVQNFKVSIPEKAKPVAVQCSANYIYSTSGDTPAPEVETFDLGTVEPADGATVPELANVTIFIKAMDLYWSGLSPALDDNDDPILDKISVTKEGSSEAIYPVDLVTGEIPDDADMDTEIALSYVFATPITEPGNYTLSIAEGALIKAGGGFGWGSLEEAKAAYKGFKAAPKDMTMSFSKAYTSTFTIESPKDPAEYVITPEPGSEISKAEFTIAFPNATAATGIKPTLEEGFAFTTSTFSVNTEKYSISEVEGAEYPTYNLVFDLDGGTLADGACTLTLYRDAFTINGNNIAKRDTEYKYTLKIEGGDEPTPGVETFDLGTVEPADGATVPELANVTIFIKAMDLYWSGLSPALDDNDDPILDKISVTKEGSSEAIYPVDLVTGEIPDDADMDTEIALSYVFATPITEPGNYTLSIAEGALIKVGGGFGWSSLEEAKAAYKGFKAAPKDMTMSFSKAYTSTFTIEATGPTFTLMPEDGKVVMDRVQNDNIGIVFEEGTEVALAEDFSSKAVIKLNDTVLPEYGDGVYGEFYKAVADENTLYLLAQLKTPGTLSAVIPGDAYTLNGQPGIDLNVEWEVVAPKEYKISITPNIATGNEVLESFKTFEITFGDALTAERAKAPSQQPNQDNDISILLPNFARIYPQVEFSTKDGYAVCTVTCSEEYTKSGLYTMSIPVGYFKLDGSVTSPTSQTRWNFKVEEPVDVTAYTLTPESGSTVNEAVFTIAFPNAKEVKRGQNWITLDNDDDPDAAVGYYEEMVVTKDATADCPTFILTAPADKAPADGPYVLAIQEGAFICDGIDCPDIYGEYTLANAVAKEFKYAITPEAGAVLTEIPEFTITFPEANDAEYTGDGYDITLSDINYDTGIPYEVEKVEGANVPTFILKPMYPSSLPNGTLILEIWEGAFTADGVVNEDIELEYTLNIAISQDAIYMPEADQFEIEPGMVMFGVMFDEAATVELAADFATQAVIKHNDTVLKLDVDYAAMAEGNTLVLKLINPEFEKAGTLSLNIPGDAYTLSGNPGFDLERIWTLIAPKDYTFTITPDFDKQSTVASLNEVMITFTNAESVALESETGISLSSSDYSYFATGNLEITENEGHPACKVTFDPAPTAKGEYTFTVNFETFLLDGISYFPGFNVGRIEKKFTLDPTSGVGILWEGSENVTVVTVDGKVIYTDAPAEVVKNLAKGLYIINGKKTIIK